MKIYIDNSKMEKDMKICFLRPDTRHFISLIYSEKIKLSKSIFVSSVYFVKLSLCRSTLSFVKARLS